MDEKEIKKYLKKNLQIEIERRNEYWEGPRIYVRLYLGNEVISESSDSLPRPTTED
jgi:hypothetical protein